MQSIECFNMSTFDDEIFECVDNFIVLIRDSNPTVTLGMVL